MTDLSGAAEALNHLADKYADDAPMSAEESAAFEALLPDSVWLAGVTAVLADFTGDIDSAAEAIEANREKCLTARHELGIEAWEMARYAAIQMGLST